jgi:hypothetical protein
VVILEFRVIQIQLRFTSRNSKILDTYGILEVKGGFIRKNQQNPEMLCDNKTGWGIFSDNVAWFIYDFFKYDLDGYEKLMFYCYYVKGMTLEEIAESACCSFQNIGVTVKKIEKRLHIAWKDQDKWRETHDCKRTDK